MISPLASLASANDSLVAAYEDLRRRVLGDSDGGKPGPGLALLLSRGMQEWMHACVQFFQIAPEQRAEHPGQEEPLPSGLRREVVVVLAGMLLQRSRRMIL